MLPARVKLQNCAAIAKMILPWSVNISRAANLFEKSDFKIDISTQGEIIREKYRIVPLSAPYHSALLAAKREEDTIF